MCKISWGIAGVSKNTMQFNIYYLEHFRLGATDNSIMKSETKNKGK